MAYKQNNCSVCLSFDFCAISLWMGMFEGNDPALLSRGEFGARVGAPRILELLNKYGVKATWFTPGHTIDTFPEAVRLVHEAGHELGAHNYAHEGPATLSFAEQRVILQRSIECIERMTGKAPIGYRSTSWEAMGPHVLGLLVEFGFVYDSSLMADDFRPYRCRIGDQASLEGPYKFGREVDLVELPVSWDLDDFPPFSFIWSNPYYRSGFADPEGVLKMWIDQFDYMYENVDEGVYTICLHPQVSGRGHRIMLVERLIQHIKSQPGAEFKTMSEVALQWREKHPLMPLKNE